MWTDVTCGKISWYNFITPFMSPLTHWCRNMGSIHCPGPGYWSWTCRHPWPKAGCSFVHADHACQEFRDYQESPYRSGWGLELMYIHHIFYIYMYILYTLTTIHTYIYPWTTCRYKSGSMNIVVANALMITSTYTFIYDVIFMPSLGVGDYRVYVFFNVSLMGVWISLKDGALNLKLIQNQDYKV